MLHNEKYIFSTYIDNKTIVFACNSYDTVQRLRNSVTHIRMSRGRWLNNAKEYKSRKDNATIQLTSVSFVFEFVQFIEHRRTQFARVARS